MARGGAVADGDYGDVIVSGSGATWTLDTLTTLYFVTGGIIDFGTGDVTIEMTANRLYTKGGSLQAQYSSTSTSPLRSVNLIDNANVPVLELEGYRATPAAGDEAYIDFKLSDAGATATSMGRLTWQADDVTNLTEDARFELRSMYNGTLSLTYTHHGDFLYISHCDLYFNQYGSTANNITIRDRNYNEAVTFNPVVSAVNHVQISSAVTTAGPTVEAVGDDANVDLNIASKGTGAIILTNGVLRINSGVIGFGAAGTPYIYDNGTELVFSVDGSNDRYDMGDTNFMPTASDGAALGSATQMWSDLYLASGGVIAWNGASNERIVHAAGYLGFYNGLKQLTRSAGATSEPLQVSQQFDSSGVQVADFEGDRATPANNDYGYINFALSNGSGTQTPVGQLLWMINDITAAAEDGFVQWKAYKNGANTSAFGGNPDYFQVSGDTIYMRGYDVITNNLYIRDYNYNEIIAMDPQASAVNHLGFRNAATGSKPIIEALGDDTNVGIDFRIKGSGEGTLSDASGNVTAGWGSGYFYTNDQVLFGGVISPAQITANQNDYTPAGIGSASVLRISSDASRDITGIGGGYAGMILIVENVGTNLIVLNHEDVLSTAANRFSMPDSNNFTLRDGWSAIFLYDGTTSRWRPLSRSISYASTATMESASSLSGYVTAGNQEKHPSSAKCWVVGTPNSTVIIASYNITSLGDTATGQQTVTIATDFSSANYCVQVTVDDTSTTLVKSATVTGRAVGSYVMNSVVEAGSGSDPSTAWHSVAFGDQ